MSNRTSIPSVSTTSPKFNGGLFSILPGGGELRVEAHGIHCPRGMAFAEYGRLSFTNDGMELRGSRPVQDDHDSLLNLVPGYWYGWPDFTTDLRSVSEHEFQPPLRLIQPHGYDDLTSVIDPETSGLRKPSAGDVLVSAFPSQSGAAGITFVPAKGPFRDFIGDAVVALFGDCAPFSTSGVKNYLGSPGYKVMRVDPTNGSVHEFIRNVQGKPTSLIHSDPDQLERPIDVKFGPDGALYVLDFGQMTMKGAQEVVTPATGKVFRLVPRRVPTTDRAVGN
jgi:glucose/arabinose dehydrogenase